MQFTSADFRRALSPVCFWSTEEAPHPPSYFSGSLKQTGFPSMCSQCRIFSFFWMMNVEFWLAGVWWPMSAIGENLLGESPKKVRRISKKIEESPKKVRGISQKSERNLQEVRGISKKFLLRGISEICEKNLHNCERNLQKVWGISKIIVDS